MYTESIESEQNFLAELIRSCDTSMKDGDEVIVCKCPVCRHGNVVTRCSQHRGSWSYEHYCNFCGETFDKNRIRSAIFLHEPFDVSSVIDTPFGSIRTAVNGKEVPFHFRHENNERGYGNPVDIKIIDIDASGLRQGDFIFCGFDQCILSADDSDERSVIFSCEDENRLLGFCAFDPEEDDTGCYVLYSVNGKGFVYEITADPDRFDKQEFYQSIIISLAVVCIDKTEFQDPEEAIFDALTTVIG